MNPFNEVAVEEAIRLKEKGRRVGDLVCFDRRQANARNATHGADNVGGSCDLGCIAGNAHQDIEPLAVAQILTGKRAIDNGMNATGQILVTLLSWGDATGPSPMPRDHRAKDAAHHRAG